MPAAGRAILTVTGLRSGAARRAQGALRGEEPSQRAAGGHTDTALRACGSGYRRRGACGGALRGHTGQRRRAAGLPPLLPPAPPLTRGRSGAAGPSRAGPRRRPGLR